MFANATGESTFELASPFQLVTKNTFLTVEGLESVKDGVEDGLKEKPNSAPPSLSSCSEHSQSSFSSERSDTGSEHARRHEDRRPHKQQRLRYRKLVSKLEERVKSDPSGVDIAALQFPASVEGDPWLRAKLLKRLKALQDDLLVQNDLLVGGNDARRENASGAASSSSGPLRMSL